MGRSYFSLIKTLSFLFLVVGVILFLKNIDTLVFTSSLDMLNLLTSIVFIATGIIGYRIPKKSKQHFLKEQRIKIRQ